MNPEIHLQKIRLYFEKHTPKVKYFASDPQNQQSFLLWEKANKKIKVNIPEYFQYENTTTKWQ